MTNRLTLTVPLAAALVAAIPAAGQHEDHQHASDAAYGEVSFPVTCEPAIRAEFSRAVAMLHSFGYEEARSAFHVLAEDDPACGMVHWGIAMSYWHPLWAPPTREELTAGRAAAERAARLGSSSPRERAYIAAINEFYRDADRRDHGTRALAYRAAMEQLAADFPNDAEAAIFHALAILGAAAPHDTSYAAQKTAAQILERLQLDHPRHPGIAHYFIHAFDYPALAQLALPAARVYADLAPQSAHARHMPSHIFTRLGLWEESIAANLACEQSAQEYVAKVHPGAASFEALHCQDYRLYAYLQIGDDQSARQLLDEVAAVRRFDEANFAVGYALLAIPARYALERRDWQRAADLELPAIELPWNHYPYALGITHFANAIGAARAGNVERARAAAARLDALHAELEHRPGGPYDWAGQLASLRLAAAGWLASAEGPGEEAVRLLTAAAEKEEEVGKHPVTPGAVLPARELLGDLLLDLNRPREALAAYETALSEAPRRFNSTLGAARAARAAGDVERAETHYSVLVELAGGATARTAALAEAREYLTRRTAADANRQTNR